MKINVKIMQYYLVFIISFFLLSDCVDHPEKGLVVQSNGSESNWQNKY